MESPGRKILVPIYQRASISTMEEENKHEQYGMNKVKDKH